MTDSPLNAVKSYALAILRVIVARESILIRHAISASDSHKPWGRSSHFTSSTNSRFTLTFWTPLLLPISIPIRLPLPLAPLQRLHRDPKVQALSNSRYEATFKA